MYTYGQPFIDKNDIKKVVKSLKGKFLTTGPYVDLFEKKVKQKLKVKNVISCNSGTSSIYLALKAIGVKKGDNIIIPSINFTAAASMSKILEANIFFADVDSVTYQLSKSKLLECLKKNKLKKIKAVFTMHLGGSAIHQKEIFGLKKKFNFFLIEDACHALGGKYSNTNKLVGSCKYSDISIFSLHPVKVVTAGEGGLVCTNNNKIAKIIKTLRSHGIIKRKKYFYEINNCSFNFRLSDINCALALSQFSKIDRFVQKRRVIAKQYFENFKNFTNKIRIVNYHDLNFSAWHLLIIEIKEKKFDLLKFYNQLIKKKIVPQLHYIPTYKFSAFKKSSNIKFEQINFNSEYYYKNCISLPIYYNLKSKDISYISSHILKIISKNSKKYTLYK